MSSRLPHESGLPAVLIPSKVLLSTVSHGGFPYPDKDLPFDDDFGHRAGRSRDSIARNEHIRAFYAYQNPVDLSELSQLPEQQFPARLPFCTFATLCCSTGLGEWSVISAPALCIAGLIKPPQCPVSQEFVRRSLLQHKHLYVVHRSTP
jgi:hypothetical protein